MTAPLLKRRPARLTKRWEPKKWDPIYEQFVALSALGLSNVEIGQRFGYTPVHVSNVVTSEQGKRLKQLMLDRLRATTISSIPQRLEDIADKTVSRLQEVMNDNDRFERSPFAVIDRGLQVLKGLRHLKGDSDTTFNQQKVVVMSDSAAKLISEGLAKSQQAEEIHGTEVVIDDKSKRTY
jgi:hypothetical protein